MSTDGVLRRASTALQGMKVALVPWCTDAMWWRGTCCPLWPLAHIWREGLKGNLRFPLWIPATRFDRVTSGLWAPRACLCAMPVWSCSSALMHRCDVMSWCPRQVSILWPSAYKAITIFKFGLLRVLVSRWRCCRRSAAELQEVFFGTTPKLLHNFCVLCLKPFFYVFVEIRTHVLIGVWVDDFLNWRFSHSTTCSL